MADDAAENGIGGRLRAARERRGLSREALAFHSGISWSAITQVESGRRRNLRPRTLAALASALGVTIDYLVYGSAPVRPMLDHRALLYDSDRELVSTVSSFLSEAVKRSEPTLVVTSRTKARRLRGELGDGTDHVRFADRGEWCRTPAAALDGFLRFVQSAIGAGAPWVRIVAEPPWSEHGDGELRPWARYESLLNLVFSYAPATVLCLYDTRELEPSVIEHACLTHPSSAELDEIQAERRASP